MAAPLLVITTEACRALLAARWQDSTIRFALPDAPLPGTAELAATPAILLVQLPFAQTRELATRLARPCADVWLHASSAGVTSGFMLAAGGDQATLQLVQARLDALAPYPTAWLHAGATGAASFCGETVARLFASQNMQLLLGMTQQVLASPPGAAPHPTLLAAMQNYMNEQAACARQLQQLARDYLAQAGSEAPFSPHHPQTRLFGLEQRDAGLAPATQLAHLLNAYLPVQP
ncbi:hypothetical protein [Chitinilyticum litopenaei]|uniref:hypothetical protein n=1 Tax=Chitinilyticum litopenaei TaxID=1121276 RepID=UPI0003FB4B49|nr:hypothetical protein [Chitinilyticum litopenaei]